VISWLWLTQKKLRVTGNKAQGKMYYRHTGYPGGIYETNFTKLLIVIRIVCCIRLYEA